MNSLGNTCRTSIRMRKQAGEKPFWHSRPSLAGTSRTNPVSLVIWSVWSIWSLWFIWFIRLVSFNQINKTNQTNQLNETDQTDRTDQMNKTGWRTFSVSCYQTAQTHSPA